MNVELMVRNWQTLIRPRRIDVEDNLSPTYGRFECAPLERGFGLTLGNSLRRVLLSSLQGAAITTRRASRACSTSSAPSRASLEDVTDVILNLKEVRLRANSLGPKQIQIKKSGAGPVTAGDFVSPDQTVDDPRAAAPRGDALAGRRAVAHRDRRGRQGLRARGAQRQGGPADRHDPDRLDLLARAQGELHRHQRAHRPRDGLRPARARDLDRRLGRARATRSPSRPRS